MEELFLRIKNILKRAGFDQEKRRNVENYNLGIFQFDATSRILKGYSNTAKLTAIEAKLLQLFCEHENAVIERDLALKRIWGDENFLRGRSLNVYVSKLRSLLKEDENIEFLNIHGLGYKMVVR